MSTNKTSDLESDLRLTVTEAPRDDAGRGVVRIDPEDIEALGVDIGDTVALEGGGRAVGKVLPLQPEERGQGIIQMDGVLRENADAGVHDSVSASAIEAPPARRVVLRPSEATLSDQDLDYIGRRIDGRPVQPDDRIRVALLGNQSADFVVSETRPAGPVLITPDTSLIIEDEDAEAGAAESGRLTYEDIGGLDAQLQQVREMIELPLRAPDVFQQLGIDAPKGVLLAGPPGCGKTLLARAVAAETDASFLSISGPEIVRKMYGESEAQLRQVFEEAAGQAPSIVFIDEIDSLAPRREDVEGDVEKRIVATLLTLMDGLEPREGVIVIAATNRPDAVDPALRRAGRFDREINIPIPDRQGRREILSVHSRGMPLAETVDLNQLAETTHGFVGADLEALCREAAMAALRRTLPDFGLGQDRLPHSKLRGVEVRKNDFDAALREVQASALREVFTEVPDVQWTDIGGLGDAKARLQEAVEWPLRHATLFAEAQVRPPRGLLLAGPPGCGKTLLAQALATETESNFISVKGPELLSKYIGESEQKVREIFRKAREAAPCIVFFDEIDAIAPSRRGESEGAGVSERVLAQFLVEMDGIEDLRDVVVMAATNRLDRIDPALLRPGRFDDLIRVDVPDAEARRAILEVHLRDKPTADTLDVGAIAERTEGFSGAELAAVCRRAALGAIRPVARHAEDDPDTDSSTLGSAVVLTQEHLSGAVREVQDQRKRRDS
ncbi:MAG: CDC48 family AAA ATPase [Salinibacter sp.]|uniref:CDC48 family AAA ATPase n=1 Tax=Salinibacter sp. TaxID=2065818 RepID=UPI0035D516FD